MNALLSLWLRLTGGETSCSRGRFALTMLLAYGLYHLLLPQFERCLVALESVAMAGDFLHPVTLLLFAGVSLALVGMLLAFLPLSPLALLGVEVMLFKGYAVLQGGSVPEATTTSGELWPSACGLLLCALALLLAGSVAFCAAWRRLKDAGRSPLFLLLGLTYLLGFGYDGSYAAESAGLYMLGPLWLIILYSQPSRRQAEFAIFRPLP